MELTYDEGRLPGDLVICRLALMLYMLLTESGLATSVPELKSPVDVHGKEKRILLLFGVFKGNAFPKKNRKKHVPGKWVNVLSYLLLGD